MKKHEDWFEKVIKKDSENHFRLWRIFRLLSFLLVVGTFVFGVFQGIGKANQERYTESEVAYYQSVAYDVWTKGMGTIDENEEFTVCVKSKKIIITSNQPVKGSIVFTFENGEIVNQTIKENKISKILLAIKWACQLLICCLGMAWIVLATIYCTIQLITELSSRRRAKKLKKQ